MASSRRAWFASFTARAMQRSSSASKSSRTVIGALILVPPNQWIRVEMNHTAASIAKSQPFQRLVLEVDFHDMLFRIGIGQFEMAKANRSVGLLLYCHFCERKQPHTYDFRLP